MIVAVSGTRASRTALRFVLLIGALSLFADFAYEGSRSVLGPFLALLGASATIVGIVTGFGEMLGYVLRLASGRFADATRAFWPITILGYAVQMTAVPLLAFAGSWPTAAALIIAERVGKAIRNPPRDVMLSCAAQQAGGYGWAFGLNEALDQFGAMLGPLSVAVILGATGNYRQAFALLLIPACINLLLVGAARILYPNPRGFELTTVEATQRGLPRVFWIYLAGAALVAAGFADYPLIAYHFTRVHVVAGQSIAIFYAVAMAVSGGGALLFGRLYDRHGFRVLIALTAVTAFFSPLVFLGSFWLALIGAALWGLGMGVHESIIPAAITPIVPRSKRATSFGLFTAGYGIAWFVGSTAIGILYDHSLAATVTFCVVVELCAIPLFIWVSRSVPDNSPI